MFHLGVRELSNQFGFHLIRNLGRYLGVPLLHERCKALDFQFVLDRMSQKLNSWKSRFLSLPGRVTLAQFTLATISYVMQSMKILTWCVLKLTAFVYNSFGAHLSLGEN